jgi:hypothetical protein
MAGRRLLLALGVWLLAAYALPVAALQSALGRDDDLSTSPVRAS